jgi:flagellin
MRIQNNVPALNAHRHYGINNTGVTKSIAKLSSGYRINSAADDAAGLAISEKMRAQIKGLTMASKNTQDATSLIQTAEGGMQEVDNMLQRIRELVVYASNDTQEQNALGTGDRQKIQDEINQLAIEIDKTANRVEFNKKKLINGSAEAVVKDGAIVGTLSDKKAAVASANDLYRLAEAKYNTAKESVQNARDTLNNALGNSDVDAALKRLVGSTSVDATIIGAAVASIQDALTSLGLSSEQAKVTTSTNLTAGDNTFTDSIEALHAAVTELNKATDITEFEQVDINTVVAAFGEAWSEGSVGAAVEAYKTTLTAAEGLATALAGSATTLGDAKTELVAAQAAYDAAEKTPALYFQVGANAGQGIEVSIGSVDTAKLGIGHGDGSGTTLSVINLSGKNINAVLDTLDSSLSYVTTQRSKLGAIQNRLEYTQNSLDISAENLTNAESRIRDVDMAKEMTSFTKMNILFQASTAMLAQANSLPQGVLQMLG